MEVEVSVQDCFSTEAQAETLQNPISTETWEAWFKVWLETLSPNVSPTNAYELSLRLTNDVEIQALNAQYRQKNQPTDVLAFAALEVKYPQIPGNDQALFMPVDLGDIVISVETASRQAQQQEHSLKTELAWLAAHGLLHLLGWDHPDDASLTKMLNQQQLLLNQSGIKIAVE